MVEKCLGRDVSGRKVSGREGSGREKSWNQLYKAGMEAKFESIIVIFVAFI